ncbi:MAG: hypothetical protein KKB46_02060 [Candidatus Omnitrophica bacterium]|nr:hypothetical protein [Candidatus Omnitrophota bacterium]
MEIIAATLVITILAAGMFGAFVGAQALFSRARHRIQAYNFAREVQERLRANYSYTDSQMGNGAGHDAESEIGSVIKGELASLGATFTYDVTEEPDGYKEVTARVSWTERSF